MIHETNAWLCDAHADPEKLVKDLRSAMPSAETVGKLAKFSALALSTAAVVACIGWAASRPPAKGAFVAAPGQASTMIEWKNLPDTASYFGVGESGLEVQVQAPEGGAFVFADGSRGPKASAKLSANSISRMEFTAVEKGESEPVRRTVRFESWSVASAAAATAAPGVAVRTVKRISGKYTNYDPAAVSVHYALAPGQSSAELSIPLVPSDSPLAREGVLPRVEFTVEAEGPFKARLKAPVGTQFAFEGGAKSSEYWMDVPVQAKGEWAFVVESENGVKRGLVVGLESRELALGRSGPKAQAPK